MTISASLLNRTNSNSEKSGEWKIISPANIDLILGSAVYRYSDIELAVKGAFDFKIPILAERIEILKKLKILLRNRKDSILTIAKTELGRTTEDLDLEWNQSELFLRNLLEDQNVSLDHATSRGLSVVLGSSVWPIFYSLHFTILNFLAGNPVILKPSEKATRTVLHLIEILRELPELKSIQALVGEKEVGRRMATHESVATVLFQGSFEVGMRVKQDALSQPSKEVLLYLGSKNPSIVFADAKKGIEEELIRDAFWGTGQHCRSISLIFVEKSRLATFKERFHELSKTFKIGGPDSGAFMGSLIDGTLLDRYLKFIGISEREGAEIVMRGKAFIHPEKGYYVTPSIACFESVSVDQLKKSVSLQTEILSPHVSVIGFETEEELQNLLLATTHGRLATVWTEDTNKAQRIADELLVGEVVINASAFTFDPWMTTQARKRSGNHAFLGRDLLSQLVFRKQVHS